MIRRPPRSTLSSSSAASDVYKRQLETRVRAITSKRAEDPCHEHSPVAPFGEGNDPTEVSLALTRYFPYSLCLQVPSRDLCINCPLFAEPRPPYELPASARI